MTKPPEMIKEKYRKALRVGSCTKRYDEDIEAQVEDYWREYEEFHQLNIKVQDLLLEKGVPMIQFIPYVNFTRKVARLRRRYSKETLKNEVASQIKHGIEAGLDYEILAEICQKLFERQMELGGNM